MLEALRNAAKTPVARVFLFLLAISFAVWGIQDIFTGYRSNALVTVGKQEVTTEEFTRQYRNALSMLSQQNGTTISQEEGHKAGIDRQVLNNLTASASLDAQAQRLHLFVSPKVLLEEAKLRPEFKDAQGVYSPTIFQQRLQQSGLTPQAYSAIQTRNSQHSAISTAVDSGFKPPRTLLEAISSYNTQQRDAKFFTISMSDADVPPPDAAAIQKQYEQAPQRYTAPEFRGIAVMKVEPADIAARITVSEADLKTAYEKDVARFSIPERRSYLMLSYPTIEEAQKAAQRLASGTDFATLAKEKNATEADITFTSKTRKQILDPVIAEAVFTIELNGTSQALSGNLTNALVKVTAIEPGRQSSFEEVKEQLRQQIQTQHAQDEMQVILEAVENERNNKQHSFEEIAKGQGIPFIQIAPVNLNGFDQNNQNVEMPAKPALLKAAFASDVGVVNDVLPFGDGYYWYEVLEVIPSALSPLDKVKPQVTQDVITQEIHDSLTSKAQALVAELKDKPMEIVAQENKAEIKTVNGITRAAPNLNFDQAAVAALFSVANRGFAWALGEDGKTAIIMQALPVLETPFDPESEASKNITQNLTVTMGQDLNVTYLEALQKNVGVVLNDVLWGEVTGTLTSPR